MTQPVETPIPAAPHSQEDYWTFFDGGFTPYRDAKLGLLTHALHYGTGCFEGLRAYWNDEQRQLYVFRTADHYRRLIGNARMLHMRVPHTADELTTLTVELLTRNHFQTDVYIRPLCYKASEEIGIRFHNLRDGFMIVAVPFGAYVDTTGGLRCQVSSWRRIDDNVAPPRSKATGLYVNSALAKTEAVANGFDEAIMLTHDGHVSEGSAENIFLLRNGRFITPPASENILEGITRETLTALIRDELGLDVVERAVDRSELYVADEIILCGTGAEVSPVIEIDRRRIGSGAPGPLTKRLQDLYFGVCRGQVEKYRDWITPVY